MNKKQLIKKIKGIEWEWGRKSSRLVCYAILKVWTESPKELAGHIKNFIIFNKDNYTNFFIRIEDLEKWGKYAYKLSVRKGFINFFERRAKKACRELIKISKLKPKKAIFDHYQEWLRAYFGVCYFVAHIRIFNRVGEVRLKEFIESKIKAPRDQIKIFSVLSATTRRNAFTDFHERMKGADQEKRKGGKRLEQLIKRIVEDFKWIPVGYGDEPAWGEEDIKNQLKSFKPMKDSHVNKDEVIKKLEPSQEILRLIKVIDLFVYYKDYLRRVCNYSHYYSRPIFIELGKKYNLNFKEVKKLLPEEIGRIKPPESSTMFFDHGKAYHFDYLKRLEKELFFHKSRKIIGTVASDGEARGKVVIINSPDDLNKNYEDRILVSVMTGPDLMPAIKSCKAIVTDEGGITCHAAIVSRELNMPCIIGTKIATKVLKDGDLVKVDANQRIVIRLKRK